MGTIIGLCLSIMGGLIMSNVLTAQQKQEIERVEKKVKARGAGYSDLLEAINLIQKYSYAAPRNKLNKISQLIENLYSTITSVSGIPEKARAQAKAKLTGIQNKISQLLEEASEADSKSQGFQASYAALSEEAKSKAKKKGPEYAAAEEEYWKAQYGQDEKKRSKAAKEFAEKYGSRYYEWDPSTTGGMIGKQAEDWAKQAEDKRKEANELGEKYV